MAEWPKAISGPCSACGGWGDKESHGCDDHGPWVGLPGERTRVEVIPADLGRELYEALRYYDDHHHPDSVLAALARYEREVGRSTQ